MENCYLFFNHLVLVILAVVGRCGPHLMIVMIFVTQNNFKLSRNFRPSPCILPETPLVPGVGGVGVGVGEGAR